MLGRTEIQGYFGGQTLEIHVEFLGETSEYQSKTMRAQICQFYDAQLCPVIAKGQRAPNAQLTHQIVDRHHEDLKSSGPDSQTQRNPV